VNAEQFLKEAGVIIAIGGVAYAVHLIWVYFLKPTYRAIIAVGEFTEALPTLIDIAHEFKSNDGETLRDQVDTTNIRLNNIEGQMEKLVQQLTTWDGTTERRIDEL